MINKLKEKIDVEKEVIITLPKNNKKNISAYNEHINNLLEEYTNLKNNILSEIDSRYSKFDAINEPLDLTSLIDEINKLKGGFYLLSNYNSSYEKLKLDKYIYNISKYYKSNLEQVIESITKVINVFNKAGINLKASDFNYSKYARDYIQIILNNKTNLDSEEVKNELLNIYLKCSNVLIYIELNFKYLYYKNKKKFDNYCNKLKLEYLNGVSSEEVLNKYRKVVEIYDEAIYNNKLDLFNKFVSKDYVANDYNDDKINNYYNKLVEDCNDVGYDEILGLSNSIIEYKSYLEISYIITSVVKLYESKDSYKDLVKNDFKEIKKIESQIFKMDKKIVAKQKRNKDYSTLIVEQDKLIMSLNETYNKLDYDNFLEKLNILVKNNTTYYEILNLVYSNYLYFIKCIKENFSDITNEEINIKIRKVEEVLLNVYNKFINNITISSDKDIKMIIGNYYKLSKFKIDSNTFENESDIDSIKDSIDKIIVYDRIKKSGYKINDIKFLCMVKELGLDVKK